MTILKILKLSICRLHQWDPISDAAINALKLTIPGIVGTICWLYFRKPFSFWITLLPPFAMFVVFSSSTYKQKFLNLTAFFVPLAIMQFAVAILLTHPFILIIFLFISSFIVISIFKYRYATIFAVLCAVIYIDLQPGWYLGVNRIIEIIISFVIISVLIIIYEYLFSIVKLKKIIVYLLELLWDSFYLLTVSDSGEGSRKLKNKYLFERALCFKSDFEVEKIFNTDTEKFSHKVVTELINKGKFIDSEEFIFEKNRNYRDYVNSIYILLRRGLRSVTYLRSFSNKKIEIYKFCPTTSILVKNIEEAFSKIVLCFKHDYKIDTFFNEKHIEKWNNECDKLAESQKNIIDDGVLESIYGIKYLITDLKKIEKILHIRQEHNEDL